jgi:hypothetical protein
VTPARRRLVALAAVLAPRRALDLLAHLEDDREAAVALAARLAVAPRHARLAALAASLPGPATGSEARREAGLHPLLARLAREPRRTVLAAPPSAATPGHPRPLAPAPAEARTGVRATDQRPGRRR